MSSQKLCLSSLEQAILNTGRFLDERDYEAFQGLMLDEAEYLVTAQAPELKQEMTWMQLGKQELAHRLESLHEHEWEIARFEQTRLISINNVDKTGQIARTSANFAIYHTDESGRSSLYAVGSYKDQWCQLDGTWRLKRRQVVLKTRQIYPLSPLPL